jgi:hypothetical protein
MTLKGLGLLLSLLLLSGCDGATAELRDAGADDAGRESPEWLTNELQSADLNRYGEAFCRREARCFGGDFRECNFNNLGTFCVPGAAATKVPDLDECLEALADRNCDAGAISECFGARNALRSSSSSRLLAEGEACGPSNVIRCDFDMYCDADPNQCGTCRKLGVAGAACRSSSECLSAGFYCAEGRCARRLPLGESCDLLAFECELGLVCSDEERCAEDESPPAGHVGSVCTEDNDCYSNTCDEGRCVARTRCGSGKRGERCAYAYSCIQGYTCEPFGLRCVPALQEGETCDPRAIASNQE